MDQHLQAQPYTTWQLIKIFWQSEHRLIAYSSLVFVLIMTMAIVGLEVAFNNWYNYFYDALQDYDKHGAIDLLIMFVFIATVYIVFSVYRYYVTQMLGLRWRRWLTEQFVGRWLNKKSYYYLENFEEHTDNPDQRIQEDIGALVSSTLDLVVGFISSVTTILAFIYILWTLSGPMAIHIGSHQFHIPGYLVWVSVIYALAGTYFTYYIGRPLVGLNFEQQRREADFRFAAVDLRTHSENIALYRGERHQKNVLDNFLYRFLDNWYVIILRQKLLLWFTAGYNQVSVILPLIVAIPNYFNKVFKLGGLIQTLQAFRMIQDSLSFIVNSYPRIAEWQAISRRLITFINHMYEAEQQAIASNHFIYHQLLQDKIITKNVTLFLPNKTLLLENINQEFIHGKNYLLIGASGIGKSTYVRAIAGIWPYGSGEISLPASTSIMYIPQKSYMPIGTLASALLFPNAAHTAPEILLKKLLTDCGLPHLTERLHYVTAWSEQLSPGELQRVAFVRILLQKPKWVFMDESTSSLDLNYEEMLYQLLKKELPSCSIITVGHRPSLAAFHDEKINMAVYSVARMAL